MNILSTHIPDIIIIEPKVFGDDRGFFMETYQARKFTEAGLPINYVQDNQSGSRQGILRGLHYQICQPQGKLVRCVVGEIYDVAVDLRRSSATFGQWVGRVLSMQNKLQIWIPPGFAHGFFVVSDWAEVLYKATDYYAPQYERTLIWNDPALKIDWPVPDGTSPILSAKDLQGSSFDQAELFE